MTGTADVAADEGSQPSFGDPSDRPDQPGRPPAEHAAPHEGEKGLAGERPPNEEPPGEDPPHEEPPGEELPGDDLAVDEPLLAARAHRPSDLIRFVAGLLGIIALFLVARFAVS